MLVAFIHVCMSVLCFFVWIDISSTPCCCFDSWSRVRLHDVAAPIRRDLPEFPHLRCFSLLLRLVHSEWLLRRRGPGSGKWARLPLVAAVCVAPLALSNAFLAGCANSHAHYRAEESCWTGRSLHSLKGVLAIFCVSQFPTSQER